MDKTAWLRQIRCTPLERGAVDALAEREGISLADALRRLVREGAKSEGLWPNANRIIDLHRPYDPDASAPGYRKTADGVFVATEAAE